ncbi:MAG TPA: hypothetical protein VF666_04510 [Pyrinomonadaceae bacterium]
MAQTPQSRNDRFDGYIPVAERIEKFYEKFPDGRITTQIVEHDAESGFILMRAEVFRTPDDVQPAATGHAFEVRGESYVNKTSYIENAETSSVGRALALLGFEVKRGIASREEIEKVARMQDAKPVAVAAPKAAGEATPASAGARPAAAASAPDATIPATDGALDAAILRSAEALGYDAAKVRKWVNQKFAVTGGLDSLTDDDKREVLKIFREKAQPAARK